MNQGDLTISDTLVSFGCLNTRSICNKSRGVMELLKENEIDLCYVTETWLKLGDAAILAEFRDYGYDIFSAPRKGRGGGVGFIFNSSVIKPVRNNIRKFKSFEGLECIVKGSDRLLRLCVVYRSTQSGTGSNAHKYDETKVPKFMEEFEDYLDSLLDKVGTPIICGDFNFKVNLDDDNIAQQFIRLYTSKGFQQHVNGPTHREGNTLDLVLTLKSKSDLMPIKNMKVDSDRALSDHYLVKFQLPIKLTSCNGVLKETKEYRELHNINVDTFRRDLACSALSQSSYPSLDYAVKTYFDVIKCILDKHAPVISKSFRTNRSPWWDKNCQEARRKKRRAKRLLKKHKNEESKALYNEVCVDAEIILDRTRNKFFDKKLSDLSSDPKSTYKVINHLLDKEFATGKLPNGSSDIDVANNLRGFFEKKVKSIYSEIETKKLQKNTTIPVKDYSDAEFTDFNIINEEELLKVVHEMSGKSCQLDIIPMWLFKNCIQELKNIVLYIVNESLSTGQFPEDLKSALIIPGLKKSNLDPDELKSYRPISNLTFLSKIIEKCVHKQLTLYIENNKLFASKQSGYRKFHSCETAVTKIHNDILIMMDKRTNVVLLLLDLSAAFDTVNHQLLLQRLSRKYGIRGSVISWLTSYLQNRSFSVKVKSSTSSSCILEIGVPQGSILGPILFILYTKDLEEIASKYGFTVHLYADDTQLYFAFDVNSNSPNMTAVKNCFSEIKDWMSLNFLKLNEDKTQFIDIGYYQSNLESLSLDKEVLQPVLKAKNLGFYFDHRLSLDDEVTATQKRCNIQLRNLTRIAGRLSHDLKVQLSHSCILSHLDYCNAVYGALTESNLQKLQKIQNSAVRFIFNLYGKKRFEHITPYLKKLHFLPVRFRIMYKVALLVYKCLNNLAPTYLIELLRLRSINSYNLRVDNDFFLLELPLPANLRNTSAAFSYNGPRVWNCLPYSLRCLNDISVFKSRLKTHYFGLAFPD